MALFFVTSMSDSAKSGAVSLGVPLANTHNPALDGIRGIAIILVLLVHLTPDSHVRGSRLLEWIYKFAWSGWIGVDLFFVLSGFLITGILLNSRQDVHYFKNFYMRRTLRIFPLYFGVLFVLFGILNWFPGMGGLELRTISPHQLWFWLYATNFGMALHPLGFGSTPALGLQHFWSLAVEEHFYLVWPAVVLFSGNRGLKKICWALIATALVLRTLAVVTHPNWLTARYALLLTPLRLDGLAAGSLMAISFRDSGGHTWFVRYRSAIWSVCALILIVDTLMKKGLWQEEPFTETIGVSVIAALAASTLALALFARSPAAARAWSHPALQFMGKYSYGIYVFHPFVQALISVWLPVQLLARWLKQPEIADVTFMIVCTILTIAVSLASYHLYEQPFLRLKKYFTAKPPSAVPARLEPSHSPLPNPPPEIPEAGGRGA
jgi:peptidoglycan/LPS O-acetylase OafA/YrhL